MATSPRELIRRRRAGRTPLLIGLAVALALFFLNRQGPLESSTFRGTVEDASAPILTYLSMPIRGVETLAAERRDRALAFEENEELKAELERLRDVERERDALARKLDAMRLHVAMPPVDNHRLVLARAVSETGGPFREAALLNAGTDQGVRVGSAVVSTAGLYGHVLRAGERSSRVLRLTDVSSRISVKSERTGARAMLTGDGTARPGLSFVDDSDEFREGDDILTSGDEGVLPQNLYVGRVGADGRVELAEGGRTADWVRVYVRTSIPSPGEDGERAVMRVVKVPAEPEVAAVVSDEVGG